MRSPEDVGLEFVLANVGAYSRLFEGRTVLIHRAVPLISKSLPYGSNTSHTRTSGLGT